MPPKKNKIGRNPFEKATVMKAEPIKPTPEVTTTPKRKLPRILSLALIDLPAQAYLVGLTTYAAATAIRTAFRDT